MSLNSEKKWHEYLEVLSTDVLKKILKENEQLLVNWTTDEKVYKTISSVRLIIASREWDGNKLINDLVSKWQELNKEWEDLDSTWLKCKQEEIGNEMWRISKSLYELWLDTDGNKLKTIKKAEETREKIIQLWLWI